jgi:hypothetical protein
MTFQEVLLGIHVEQLYSLVGSRGSEAQSVSLQSSDQLQLLKSQN